MLRGKRCFCCFSCSATLNISICGKTLKKNVRFALEGSSNANICFPCSVGTSKTLFATPPQRECDFLHFFQHLPSEKLKNHENAIFEPLLRHHVANDADSKSLKIRRLPQREVFAPKIALRENARIRSRTFHFPMDFNKSRKSCYTKI